MVGASSTGLGEVNAHTPTSTFRDLLVSLYIVASNRWTLSAIDGGGFSVTPHCTRKDDGTGKSRTFLSSSMTFAYGGCFAPKAVVMMEYSNFVYCHVQIWTTCYDVLRS